VKKLLCANCMQSYDAARMRRAGENYYCVLCYEDLVETSKRRPPVAAVVPEEVAAQIEEADAARRDPALVAEAGDLEDALALTAPAPEAGAPRAREPGPQALARRMRLAEEVGAHHKRRLLVDTGLMLAKLVIYVVLIAAAMVCGGVVRFGLVGFFAADFFVWVVVSVFSIPFSRVSVGIEFAAYLALMLLFTSGADLVATPATNDEIAVTAGTFLVTFFAKSIYHGRLLMDEIFGD